MNKKVSLGVTLALVIVAITATFAVTMSLSMRTYNNLIKDLPSRVQMYSSVAELDELVRKEYYGDINDSTLNSNISAGYIKGLADPYSYYMTANEYVEYYERNQGKRSGIGINPTLNPDTGYIYVTAVFENSPAKTGGLQKGDEIIAVEGVGVTAENYLEMLEKLEGEKLTSVNITLLRDGEESSIKVARGYEAQTVIHSVVGEIGYIRIIDFYANTIEQFQTAIDSVISQGVTNIIFDVRNNAGSSFEYASKVLDILVPIANEGTGAIATAVNNKGETIETFSSDAKAVLLPMTVLINNNTQGAAELFACDLRDFGKATLVGDKTSGKGTMQKIFQLDDGGAVMLTVAKILPYKSDAFDGVGIMPDYEISLTKEQMARFDLLEMVEDTQLQKAIELLSEGE